MEAYRLLYVTVPDDAVGRTLARRMVEERLAACVHLLPAGESFFHWDDELVEEAERVLIAKTRADLAEYAIERIASWHSYEVPCVLALPIEAGHGPFLKWISAETRPAG